MNLLNPPIVVIGKRRYRKNPFTLSSFQNEESKLEPYQEESSEMFMDLKNINSNRNKQEYNQEDDDEPCDLDCKLIQKSHEDEEDLKGLEMTENKFYKYTMLVHQSYIGFIIGRNSEKKMKLENETKSKIKFPKRGQGDWLIIEAKDKSSIISCKNRILLQIYTARHQKSFTHLILFPLKFEPLKLKFDKFRQEVLKLCGDDRGVDDSIFQNPNKLHLTICTAVLLNENEIDQAVELLNEARSTFIKEFLNSKKLDVKIAGLEYMNDDPADVDVLYAKINPINPELDIEIISNKLMENFIKSGLSKRQFDRVKIHATVMNSLKRQDQNYELISNSNTKINQRESFDARNILKNFGNYDFGCYTLNEIHLSLRYSAAADGFYGCISKITL